ncbi:hypothetical protein V5O48_005043 [Marasmius crinis-equi]|uniref:EngB-type G domain-containing protein n=1 Tax=Marasmius crinis-equi TaxID=585013 RepID=A0ABR3FNF5_9AGAR
MLIFHHVRPRVVPSAASTRSISLFTRHAHAAELVATAKPRKSPATPGSEADYFPKLGNLPEVVVTGRANSGKSTLLNAVLGRKGLVGTSKQAGHTRTLNFYRVGEPGKLVIVDAPGYGKRGRPEWGELFDEYVQNRHQLRQILVTLNLKNGINDFDRQMIQKLFQNVINDYAGLLNSLTNTTPSSSPPSPPKRPSQVRIQPIFTKADELPAERAEAQKVVDEMAREVEDTVKEATRKSLGGCEPAVADKISKLICRKPIITSSVINFGVEEVRIGILKACGLTATK